jgi:hypothetical protein
MIGAGPRVVAKWSANRSGSIVALVMMSLRSGRRGQDLVEVAQQEIDVEAALVRLVDDQRVVLAEEAVGLGLREQDPVGHQLDHGAVGGLVAEPDLASRRSRPASCPASSAMRAATVRAAMRRGWVCPITPSMPRPSPRAASMQILGSWVVLPDPVSPQRTTTWCSRMVAAISSRIAETGRSSGYSISGGRRFAVARRGAGPLGVGGDLLEDAPLFVGGHLPVALQAREAGLEAALVAAEARRRS